MDAASAFDSFAVLPERPGRLAPSLRAFAAVYPRACLRPSRLLPTQFAGLRAVPRALVSPSAESRNSRRRVVGSVVCEAQDTALLPEVDKTTWKSLVLDSATPVLVDFWAPWCGPCRMVEPTIVKLAKTYEGKLKCYKLNTDENSDLATQYSVRSIPTMIIFKNGEKKETIIGAVVEDVLVKAIDKFVES